MMSFMHNFSGRRSLELSKMQTETRLTIKLTYFLKLLFLDDSLGFVWIKNHQCHPCAVLVDVSIPADAKKDMDSFFMQFRSNFRLWDLRLKVWHHGTFLIFHIWIDTVDSFFILIEIFGKPCGTRISVLGLEGAVNSWTCVKYLIH